MVYHPKLVLLSGRLTSGMVLQARLRMGQIPQSIAQNCIRATASSQHRTIASHDRSLAMSSGVRQSSNVPETDQRWDSSRGIKFGGLSTEEVSLDHQVPRTVQGNSISSVPLVSLPSSMNVANPASQDHTQGNGDQTTTENSSSSSLAGEANIHEETRLADRGLRSPLGYHIPQAKMQDLSSSSSYWQYHLYEGPQGEKVKIHYCTSRGQTERVSQLFLDQEVVGFDLEWKPGASIDGGIRQNVALVQLASEERIALFHFARFFRGESSSDFLAPTLRKILESSTITKVGVSVKADCTRLRQFLDVDVRGIMELSHLYKLVKYFSGDVTKINKVLVSLAQQVQEHLHLPLWKGDVRCSDWSRELDYDQIRYAASDSYAGFQLYHILENKRKALSPTPPRPAHAELNRAIQLANGETIATIDDTADSEDEASTIASEAMLSVESLAHDLADVVLEDTKAPESVSHPSQPTDVGKSISVPGPELSAANSWAAQWRVKSSSGPDKPRSFMYQLRAYALWHNQQHTIATTAALLRHPPLQKATVATYVLDVLRAEKLPFEVTRLMDVLECLPQSGQARYNGFLKRIGFFAHGNLEKRESLGLSEPEGVCDSFQAR